MDASLSIVIVVVYVGLLAVWKWYVRRRHRRWLREEDARRYKKYLDHRNKHRPLN